MHDLAAGPEGERATARGSGAAGVGYCFNWMLSTVPYTELLKERGPKWLHLYIFKERELVQRSIELAEKANQTAGDSGFSAIILTCDHPHNRVRDRMVPGFGQRWMDMDCSPEAMNRLFFPNQVAAGWSPFTRGEVLSGLRTSDEPPGGNNDPSLTWQAVEWVCSITSLPVVVKGILSPADAVRAVKAGASAIVVSNHGGRQFDAAPPAIEVLTWRLHGGCVAVAWRLHAGYTVYPPAIEVLPSTLQHRHT